MLAKKYRQCAFCTYIHIKESLMKNTCFWWFHLVFFNFYSYFMQCYTFRHFLPSCLTSYFEVRSAWKTMSVRAIIYLVSYIYFRIFISSIKKYISGIRRPSGRQFVTRYTIFFRSSHALNKGFSYINLI